MVSNFNSSIWISEHINEPFKIFTYHFCCICRYVECTVTFIILINDEQRNCTLVDHKKISLWSTSKRMGWNHHALLRTEIECDGSWQRMGILISDRFTISWEAPCPLFFLRKVFGRLRLIGTFPSLCGLLYGIGSLQVIIWGVEGWILLIGVSCAVVMGRRWIICYYIVVRLIGYRVWCLDLLGFFGSCQDRLRILYLVGGIGLESICLAFGI